MAQSATRASLEIIDRTNPIDRAVDTNRPSPATRYLAAAAYTDRKFREKAIEMRERKFRARAPEPGIDADLVLQHCYIARRRVAWRDAALCLVLIIVAFTGIVRDLLNDPDDAALIVQYYAGPLILCWLLAATVVFIDTFRTQHVTLAHHFAPHRFARMHGAPGRSSASPGNVVVYGAFSPFVGSGLDLGGWSFTVNLEQAKPNLETDAPEDFDIDELYAVLRKGFERLKIDGLSVQDRLFVDGCAIRDDRRLLPDLFSCPVNSVDRALMQTYLASSSKMVRHYLCLEISDWSGQLVLSTFIRLHKSASKLFVETSNFILPPLKDQYYGLDKHTSTQLLSKIVAWLIQAAISAPVLALMAPFSTWHTLWRPVNRHLAASHQMREIRNDPLYNYGARESIRELGTANAWRVYFQKLDKEMHSKVIQQQQLDVLISFLDDHGVDTSEIKDRGSHILNNGVIVSGGAMNVESLAVGEGARASVAKSSGHKKERRLAGAASS